MTFDNIILDRDGPVAVATLNRPKQLNALSYGLCKDLCTAFEELDRDDSVRVFVITGGERVFAAGADINEMVDATPFAGTAHDRLVLRDRLNHLAKPVIAAVSGFALGGGCELAMSCDIIIASESAVFGQPEVNLGVIPGSGGTQRLTHLVGKHKAMELVLTGRFMNAAEAERSGLVNKVVPAEVLLDEAMAMAHAIARKPPIAVRFAKEAILKAANAPLDEGLAFERKSFYTLFASEDRREGMKAFLDKRKPEFKGK
ncbi:MAG: enoyl-CoA hydratase-related protein [Deltaproteobacteria bacterium]|nr:enoyl-CoA hydratase-related protein [Deltaproteobacteria bacterium]